MQRPKQRKETKHQDGEEIPSKLPKNLSIRQRLSRKHYTRKHVNKKFTQLVKFLSRPSYACLLPSYSYSYLCYTCFPSFPNPFLPPYSCLSLLVLILLFALSLPLHLIPYIFFLFAILSSSVLALHPSP